MTTPDTDLYDDDELFGRTPPRRGLFHPAPDPTRRDRRVFTAVFVIVLLLMAYGSSIGANAATPNWLNRACGHKGIATSCVEDTIGDQVLASRSLAFRDAAGTPLVVTKRAAIVRLAKQHSVKCPPKGELRGCYRTEPGIGMAITLPDGLGLAVKLFRK